MSDKSEEIKRAGFISAIIVGPCPKCGSNNTHDCESYKSGFTNVTWCDVVKANVEDSEIADSLQGTGPITNLGSDCPVAKLLDAIDIGHCDSCGALWCLECGEVLKEAPLNEISLIVSAHFHICPAIKE